MSTASKVNKLWEEFRDAIDASYADGQKNGKFSGDAHAEVNCLRDYARDISWHDDLAGLVGRETANERQHRRNEISPRDFSVGTAAKLILMNQASFGSTLPAMPPATLFLTARQSAAEAEVIGYLCREHITAEWRAELATLDYAKIMAAARAK